MNDVIAAEFGRLSAEEKLQLVTELWDQLSSSEDSLPLPESHRRLLAEDEAKYRAEPQEGSEWQSVRKRISESK